MLSCVFCYKLEARSLADEQTSAMANKVLCFLSGVFCAASTLLDSTGVFFQAVISQLLVVPSMTFHEGTF